MIDDKQKEKDHRHGYKNIDVQHIFGYKHRRTESGAESHSVNKVEKRQERKKKDGAQ